MARLADQLRQWIWSPPGWYANADRKAFDSWKSNAETMKAMIPRSVIIAADNVCEYFFAGNDKEEWDYQEDFPCCAPPFPEFFVEMSRPSCILSSVNGVTQNAGLPIRWGWLFSATDKATIKDDLAKGKNIGRMQEQLAALESKIDRQEVLRAMSEYASGKTPKEVFDSLGAIEQSYIALAKMMEGLREDEELREGLAEAIGKVGWTLVGELVMVVNSGVVIGPVARAILQIGDDGAVLCKPLWAIYGGEFVQGVSAKDMIAGFGPTLMPALLALSFMNCKNVEVVRHDPPAPTAREERRGVKPLLSYHTLNIAPMQRVLRTEGNSEASGLQRALHICRGHFASYTEKALFGKYFGRFWVPAHVRGHQSAGIVTKDYDVRP